MFKKFRIISLLAVMLAPSMLFAGSLDGTIWDMREKGTRLWATDQFKFENGQFKSKEALGNGFNPTDYEVTQNQYGKTWTAAHTNEKNEKIEWVGMSTNNRMEGSYTINKPNGERVVRYWKADLVTP